jgi:hypothetical protein
MKIRKNNRQQQKEFEKLEKNKFLTDSDIENIFRELEW